MCYKVVSQKPFILKYCLDKYLTQKVFPKAVDSYLLASKFVFDWFVTSEIIEKLDNAVVSNGDIVLGGIDSDIVTFFSNDIGLNSVIMNNINLDDDDFGDCDPETINHGRLMAWYNRYKQHKKCKKKIDKKIMSAA